MSEIYDAAVELRVELQSLNAQLNFSLDVMTGRLAEIRDLLETLARQQWAAPESAARAAAIAEERR